MRRHRLAAMLGLALASSTILAVFAQQDARALRRLLIAGSFTPGFNADRSELTLAAGEGSIDGVEVRAPDGGSLSVSREAIPGSEKRRLVVTFSAGTPGPGPAREPSSSPSASPPSPGPAPAARPSHVRSPGSKPEQECRPGCRISQTCELQDGGTHTCVDPEWQPVSCQRLPDDPPTLVREPGPGCDATGGNGTSVISVTNLQDAQPTPRGSFRWAYNQIDATRRRVVCDPSLTGDIVLTAPLKWTKPRTTLDFSMCDVAITGAKPGQPILIFEDFHNNIVHSVRCKGLFPYEDSSNWRYTAKGSCGVMTGDTGSNAVRWPWDDRWDSPPPLLRKSIRSSIFDRLTGWAIEDHGIGGMHGGVRDTQVTRSLIANSFHPSSLGAWTAPLPQAKWRFRVMHAYNVWAGNGERQTKPREQTHLWLYLRNLVYNWTFYEYRNADGKRGLGWPMGLNISDDFVDENDLGWILGSCFVPGPGSRLADRPSFRSVDHSGWGVIFGNGWTCEACGPRNCCGPQPCEHWNLKACNAKLRNSRFYFEANEGKLGEGHTWPADWKPPPLPFPVDKARPWSRVLAEVGVVRRNATEQALIDTLTAALPGCTAPQ